MTAPNQETLDQLQRMAEIWLKRPLTPVELQQLQAFLHANAGLDMGQVYQSMSHATGILFENASTTQQQQNTLTQAAANQGVMQIYSLDTTAAAGATEKVAQAGVADNLTSLLTVLKSFS
jgi:Killing trait